MNKKRKILSMKSDGIKEIIKCVIMSVAYSFLITFFAGEIWRFTYENGADLNLVIKKFFFLIFWWMLIFQFVVYIFRKINTGIDSDKTTAKMVVFPSEKSLESETYLKYKRVIAIHEAGHAVTGLKLGFELKNVELHYEKTQENEMFKGATHYDFQMENFMYKEFTRNLIVASYAGPAVEKIVYGYVGYGNADSDFSQAQILIRQMLLTSDEYNGYIMGQKFDEMMNDVSMELFAEAEKIVRENLDDIKKVADQLVENNILMGERVKKIIKSN